MGLCSISDHLFFYNSPSISIPPPPPPLLFSYSSFMYTHFSCTNTHTLSVSHKSCPSSVSGARPTGHCLHQHTCHDSRRDHSKTQHCGTGHRYQGRHGQGTVWEAVQLDCEQDQPTTQLWKVSIARRLVIILLEG